MKRFVALLRGININGKNKISMTHLKQNLETLGFENVKTLLNSGNAAFSCHESRAGSLSETIKVMLRQQFGLDIPVFIIAQEDLQNILNHAPDWWGNDSNDIYDNLILIMPPASFEDVYREIGAPKENLEQIKNEQNAIFWSFNRKNYQKTNWWHKTATVDIRNHLTIRTANTVKKIARL